MKFNSSKVQLKVNEVLYVGNIDSNTGISPGPGNVKVLVGIALPEGKHAPVQFLNMVKYPEKKLSQYNRASLLLYVRC